MNLTHEKVSSQAVFLLRALKLSRTRTAIRSAAYYNTREQDIFDERFVNLHSHVTEGQRPERRHSRGVTQSW